MPLVPRSQECDGLPARLLKSLIIAIGFGGCGASSRCCHKRLWQAVFAVAEVDVVATAVGLSPSLKPLRALRLGRA